MIGFRGTQIDPPQGNVQQDEPCGDGQQPRPERHRTRFPASGLVEDLGRIV